MGNSRSILVKIGGPSAVLAFFAAAALTWTCQKSGEVTVDPDLFQIEIWENPPVGFRPRVRWWWPGGSVTGVEIERELNLFAEQGFGGVEIQPFAYGFTREDLDRDPRIRSVGSEEFFRNLADACRVAEELGLSVSITLGSGWPTGGPFVSEGKARQLLMSSTEVDGPAYFEGDIPPPARPRYHATLDSVIDIMAPFDEEVQLVAVTAARVAEVESVPVEIGEMRDLSNFVSGSRLAWEVPEGSWRVFAFYENDTNQLVLTPAFAGGATGAFVPDHLRSAGISDVLEGYGAPLVAALESYIGRTFSEVFIDSFELAAELPWTPDFLDRFSEEMGYDLTPYLPLLFREYGEAKWLETLFTSRPMYSSGETGLRVREDYEEVRSLAFRNGHVVPLLGWAHGNGLAVRMQSHGGYGDILDGYAAVDVPESEGLYAGGSYDFLKLASSAAHTAGRRFVSSEMFVTLTDSPRDLERDDFFFLAGRAFGAGINRLYHHGYPYRYSRTDGTRWYPFEGTYAPTGGIALAFTSWSDEDHPVWPDFPDLHAYLSRLSYALSRGEPRAELAWLHQDRSFPDRLSWSFGDLSEGEGDSPVTAALKGVGVQCDRISRGALEDSSVAEGLLAVGQARYRGLLVTDLESASPELMRALERIVEGGIPVIVLGGLPDRSLGLTRPGQSDQEVAAVAGRIEGHVIEVATPDELGGALESAGIRSPIAFSRTPFPCLLSRRAVGNGEVILLANQSGQELTDSVHLDIDGLEVCLLDPRDGEKMQCMSERDELGRLAGVVSVAARRAVLLWVRN